MPTDALINVNGENVQTLEILFITTVLALLPSLFVMMTSFTRYIIVISFLRTAMGTQQVPPNLVLVGVAIILTLFTMRPTLDQIYDTAYEPYVNEQISQEEFLELAVLPLREFMFSQMQQPAHLNTISMYCELAGEDMPVDADELRDLPFSVVVASFITCELKRAFEMGFLISIPFLLVDMVIAATLMSMGMMMLPPSMISLPFKLLLFVTLDGWNLVFVSLVQSVS